MRTEYSDAAAKGARPILVVNPNSNPAVSDLIRKAARCALPSGMSAKVVNPAIGPLSIQSEKEKAEAVPRVLKLVQSEGAENFSAIVMGCFDDLALTELRDLFSIPVIGTFESGLIRVRSLAPRFGIVTTFNAALPGIEILLERYGASGCVGIRTAGIDVSVAARPNLDALERVENAVWDAIESDGARAILLGSGGFTGWAERLGEKFGVPIVDGVESALRVAAAFSLVRCQ